MILIHEALTYSNRVTTNGIINSKLTTWNNKPLMEIINKLTYARPSPPYARGLMHGRYNTHAHNTLILKDFKI